MFNPSLVCYLLCFKGKPRFNGLEKELEIVHRECQSYCNILFPQHTGFGEMEVDSAPPNQNKHSDFVEESSSMSLTSLLPTEIFTPVVNMMSNFYEQMTRSKPGSGLSNFFSGNTSTDSTEVPTVKSAVSIVGMGKVIPSNSLKPTSESLPPIVVQPERIHTDQFVQQPATICVEEPKFAPSKVKISLGKESLPPLVKSDTIGTAVKNGTKIVPGIASVPKTTQKTATRSEMKKNNAPVHSSSSSSMVHPLPARATLPSQVKKENLPGKNVEKKFCYQTYIPLS